MTVQTIANALLILVLVGWIASRQLSWRPVNVSRMWRLPIVLGAIGLFEIVRTTRTTRLTTFDMALLAIELVISLAVGSLMGAIARFRPATASERADAKAPADFESRTGWFGLALWVVFIGVRIGLDVVAGSAGSTLAASTGVIFVMVAANRLARTFVFATRVSRLETVAA